LISVLALIRLNYWIFFYYLLNRLYFLLVVISVFIAFSISNKVILAQNSEQDKILVQFEDVPSYYDALFWVELASAVFFAMTVVFLIIDYRNQQKDRENQVEQMRQDAYSRIREHHHDLLRLQIEEELTDVFTVSPEAKYNKDTDESCIEEKDRYLYNFYLAEFDLFERVRHLVDDPNYKSVNESEWISWLIYLEKFSQHYMFRYTFERTTNIFSEDLVEAIQNNIIDMGLFARDYLHVLKKKVDVMLKLAEYMQKEVTDDMIKFVDGYMQKEVTDDMKKLDEYTQKDKSELKLATIKTLKEIYMNSPRKVQPSKLALKAFGSLLEAQETILLEAQKITPDEICKLLSNLEEIKIEMPVKK